LGINVELLSEVQAKKLFRQMLFLGDLGYEKSIASIYSEMQEYGYSFSLWDSEPKQIYKNDKDYTFAEVKFVLFLVNESNGNSFSTPLSRWSTVYVMTNKDILYNNWNESNVVWTHHSTCKVGSILDTCKVEIDKLDFLRRIVFSS